MAIATKRAMLTAARVMAMGDSDKEGNGGKSNDNGRGSTRKNVIFSNSLWTNSEYPNLLKNMFILSL
jgi:hypothetical protein